MLYLTANRACLAQTLPDPEPPSVPDPDDPEKLLPRWKPRVIGFEPGVPVAFPYGKEEIKDMWVLAPPKDLKFTSSEA